MMPELSRLTAFSTDPAGGNPAGVWIGDRLPGARDMQRIATEVGFSETAFLAPLAEGEWVVRYFSPKAEVPFCGHATIASGVRLGQRFGEGTYRLATRAGEVPVRVRRGADDHLLATLTSVDPAIRPLPPGLLQAVLGTLGWQFAALDPALPPGLAYAGAWHLVLALRERRTLAALAYDFDALGRLMLEHELTTLQLVWRRQESIFDARNPFPVGGVVEDPATGAAAAALGGYLRALGLLEPPADFEIRQGDDMGRPSRLQVHVPLSGGIEVSGPAVRLVADAAP